jgi:hypothetical protein
VEFDGAFADVELFGNLFVAHALGQAGQDLALTNGEGVGGRLVGWPGRCRSRLLGHDC